jgi:hypothetical protein
LAAFFHPPVGLVGALGECLKNDEQACRTDYVNQDVALIEFGDAGRADVVKKTDEASPGERTDDRQGNVEQTFPEIFSSEVSGKKTDQLPKTHPDSARHHSSWFFKAWRFRGEVTRLNGAG